jgi:hypothetical protein
MMNIAGGSPIEFDLPYLLLDNWIIKHRVVMHLIVLQVLNTAASYIKKTQSREGIVNDGNGAARRTRQI